MGRELAIIALILSIVSLFTIPIILPIVGLILGIISFRQSGKPKDSSRGLAIAAIVISAVILVFQILMLIMMVMWLRSYFYGMEGKTLTIPNGGATCDSEGIFHIRVLNTGTEAIDASDWTETSIRGDITPDPTFLTPPSTIPVKSPGDFNTSGINGKHGGFYIVVLNTEFDSNHQEITCP